MALRRNLRGADRGFEGEPMATISISTGQLDYFTTVYRKRSFSAAARTIPMSPQGFTKAIHVLERELGVTLFKLDESGMLSPTPYADVLYEHVLSWYQNLKVMQEDFRRISADDRQHIHLGAAIGIPGFFGIDFVENFMKKHKDILVRCVETPDSRCEEELLNGEYDLALTVAPYNDAFETVEIYSTELSVWINKKNKLSEKEFLVLEDLEDQNFACMDRSFKVYDQVLTGCEKTGIHLKSMATCAEMIWLYNYAQRNKGIGCSAPHLTSCLPDDDSVMNVPIKGVYWKFGVSRLKDHNWSPAERTFINYLTESVRDVIANRSILDCPKPASSAVRMPVEQTRTPTRQL